ncbi:MULTISPECIES: hypothetical protein [Moraxella]|jgi:lipoprotein|uniref:Lipoprotein n=1 Tax=Moraxella lacunata TaxID=477 RepID=A0A1B8PXR7_MORLA|nr:MULTISPECIES: hypothetical protein [Moraxella]MBE9578529.1 hypothetical protein [Moraxella sp. K1664]MBE9587872.1 hypothetical protein [Moraxella sp. K1630]MBE9590252.1 hypothetical protein [Moraxella sp. K127]MBE9596048.1 hypothetical protein [Moraxella sp. K2450]MDH9218342.1 hypothetical protein [Moraxella lacunata]
MKKPSLAIVAVLPLFLTACSDPTWNKAGVNLYETQNQLAKCQYEIGLAKVSKDEKTALLNQCMKSKGFRYN